MAYYGKLPIILLSELAAGKEDSYDCRIASYLLGHLGQDVSIDQIAKDCYVSKSAVSRFCRNVGLEDFIELKELLRSSEKAFEILYPSANAKNQITSIAQDINTCIQKVAETIDLPAVDTLARCIRTAHRVACFGLLKAEAAALNLQSDLVMLGKNAVTKISFREQMEYLSSASEDDLIIVFSYKGIYFDYDLPFQAKQSPARIWLVTGGTEAEKSKEMFEGMITFRSNLDFVSHPYQLITASTIIAQRYAALIEKPGHES